MGHVQAGDLVHQFAVQVGGGAVATGRIVHLAGLGLGPGHEVFQILGRVLGPGHRDVAALADLADIGELFDRVVRWLALQIRCDGKRAGVGQQQGVAVGRLAGQLGGGNHAAGTGFVVHHDLLLQRLLHRHLHGARGKVDATARRVTHHHTDGFAGVGLRKGQASGRGQRGKSQRGAQGAGDVGGVHGAASLR